MRFASAVLDAKPSAENKSENSLHPNKYGRNVLSKKTLSHKEQRELEQLHAREGVIEAKLLAALERWTALAP